VQLHSFSNCTVVIFTVVGGGGGQTVTLLSFGFKYQM
jgi:hypothetical protein